MGEIFPGWILRKQALRGSIWVMKGIRRTPCNGFFDWEGEMMEQLKNMMDTWLFCQQEIQKTIKNSRENK